MKTKPQTGLFSLQRQTCFTAEELWQYRYGHTDPALRAAIHHHLNLDRCESCMEMFMTLPPKPVDAVVPDSLTVAGKRLRDRWATETPAIKLESNPATLTAGQIWSTRACLSTPAVHLEWRVPIAGPVMIMHPGSGTRQGIIRIMPISTDVLYARPPQSMVISDGTIAPYPMLVEIFNERPMLAEHLDHYVGQLDNADFEAITTARNAWLDLNTGDDAKTTDPDYEGWVKTEIRLAEHLSAPVMAYLESDIEEDDDIDIIPAWMAAEFVIQPVQLHAQETEAGWSLPSESLILLDQPDLQLGLVQKQDQIILRLIAPDITTIHITINGTPLDLLPVSGNVHESVIGFATNMPDHIDIILVFRDGTWKFQPKFIAETGGRH
ncbi:MAG: hypothetical protein AB7S77_23370 [Desulfatirhabdiaceae bacterium]